MLYRLLLIVSIALGLAACIGEEDYEISTQGEVEALPEPEPEPDPSILSNGGLEGSSVGETSPAGWTIAINDGDASIEVSADQYFNGSKSLKATIVMPGANPWDIEAGPSGIAVSSEFDYEYTAWVLGTPGAIANFTASLPVDPWTTFGSQRVEVTNQWQKVSFKFSIPDEVTELRLPVQLSQVENEGVTIYIDGISLVPVSKEVAPFRPLPVDSGWRVSAPATNLTYSGAGVSYSPTEGGQQLVYDLVGPENYHLKTFTFEIIADQAFIDSGANVQPFAQLKEGTWPGEWNCWINNGDLSVDGMEYNCTLNEVQSDVEIFNLSEGQEIQVGIQVVGSPAGTITIASWSVDLPALSDVPLDSDWRVSDGLEVSYSALGVSYSPTADNHQLLYDLAGPDNLEGATFIFTITASQEYIDSGASLQPFAQQTFGDWAGEWNCWINNADLSTDGGEYSCTFDETGAPFNLADASETLQFGLQAKGSPAGTITINNIEIVYPGLSVAEGWRTSNSLPITYGGGVSYSPTADNHQLVADIAGPDNLAGATFVFTIAASQEYIDSGANLQPFAQQTFGDWVGHWSCWINNGDLSTSGAEHSCTVGTAFNLANGQGMQVGVQAKGTTVAGAITIRDVTIIYAD